MQEEERDQSAQTTTQTHTSMYFSFSVLTISLRSSPGCQGNGVLHGSTQAQVSTVTVTKAGSIDVELGVLGGEG